MIGKVLKSVNGQAIVSTKKGTKKVRTNGKLVRGSTALVVGGYGVGTIEQPRKFESVNRFYRKRVKRRKEKEVFLVKFAFTTRPGSGTTRNLWVGGHIKNPIFLDTWDTTVKGNATFSIYNLGPGEDDWIVTVRLPGSSANAFAAGEIRVYYGKPSLGTNWTLPTPFARLLDLVGPGFLVSRIQGNPLLPAGSSTTTKGTVGIPTPSVTYGQTFDIFGSTITTAHGTGYSLVGPVSGNFFQGTISTGFIQTLVGFTFTGTNYREVSTRATFTWGAVDGTPGNFGPYGFGQAPCTGPPTDPPVVLGTTTWNVPSATVVRTPNIEDRTVITQKPIFEVYSGALTTYAGSHSVRYLASERVLSSFGYCSSSNSVGFGVQDPNPQSWQTFGFGNNRNTVTFRYGCATYSSGPTTQAKAKYLLTDSVTTDPARFNEMQSPPPPEPRTVTAPFNLTSLTQVPILPGVLKDYSEITTADRLFTETVSSVTYPRNDVVNLSRPAAFLATGNNEACFWNETRITNGVVQGNIDLNSTNLPYNTSVGYEELGYYRTLAGEDKLTGFVPFRDRLTFIEEATQDNLAIYEVGTVSNLLTRTQVNITEWDAAITATNVEDFAYTTDYDTPMFPLVTPDGDTFSAVTAKFYPD